MTNSPTRIHQHWSLADAMYHLADAGCVAAGLALAAQVAIMPLRGNLLLAGAATIIVFFLAGSVSGLYRDWRGSSTEREVLCALVTWLYAAPLLLALRYLVGFLAPLPRSTLLVACVVVPALLIASRVMLRVFQYALRAKGINSRRFAIVGINDLAFRLARNIENSPQMGLKLAGLFDDRPSGRLPHIPEGVGSHIGTIDELVEQARTGQVHLIYVAFPMRAEKRIKDVLARLGDTTASVYLVPDFFVFELLHSRWTSIGGLPAVSIFENPFYGVDGLIKRALDVTLAGLLLTLLALPMAVVALAVKLSSPGPVFFRQKRYGLDGREIDVWKFRSMSVCENGPTVAQATKNDPRVTRVGAMLRRTSLDELPQLFNVLDGSMSLVGPRPHATAHNEAFRKLIQGYMLRHKVKPGITGLAQVSGARGETDTVEKMQKRIEYDHQYIRDWSPWLDLKILFRTIFAVLKRENAY